MESGSPDNFFLEKLEEQLLQLPSYLNSSLRKDSWMTSSEISNWSKINHYGQFTSEDIEEFLLEKWKNNELKNIRPAKYPHLSTLQRLWGHKERTYPQYTAVSYEKTDSNLVLPRIKLPEGALKLFLSHSSHDGDLAVSIREVLGQKFGVEVWLSEAELTKGKKIFEEIYLSICHCDAVALLLTVHSLGSAWVESELETSLNTLHKKIITIIDGTDEDLMFIIDKLEENKYTDIHRLVEKYKKKETGEHRVARFKENAIRILGYLQSDTGFVRTIFPAKDNVDKKYKSMQEALDFLKDESKKNQAELN